MATAGDLIAAAFIKVGVQVPTTAQTSSALISLNNMMSLLGADLMTYCVTSEGFSLAATDPEYTVGPAGQWDTVRPLKVLSCFLRDDDNYDHPIRIMDSVEYRDISSKSWDGRPTALYFLPEYPLAKIIFDARPIDEEDVYFEFLKNFTEFALTTTTVTLPPEYKEGLVYNLAVSLGEDWDRVVSKTIYAQAMRTREVIDRLNASNRKAPRAKFDFVEGIGFDITSGGGTTGLIDGGAF